MRRTLAAAALAAAALGTTAPAASAGCYGVRDYATACYPGYVEVVVEEKPYCVYTGGDTCETYYVPVPGTRSQIHGLEICLGQACMAPIG